MEEDILRRRQNSIAAKKYTFCTTCGCPIPRSRAVLIRSEALGEAKSEHGELCPECADTVYKGEHLPTE